MYVYALKFVELIEKTERTKPHPLSKFIRHDVDTLPLPVRKPANKKLMDQKKKKNPLAGA